MAKSVSRLVSRRPLVVCGFFVSALLMAGCGVSPADPTQGTGDGTGTGTLSATDPNGSANGPTRPADIEDPWTSSSAAPDGDPSSDPAHSLNPTQGADPTQGVDPTQSAVPSVDPSSGSDLENPEEHLGKDGGIDWSIWPQNVTLSSRLVDVIVPGALTAIYPSHALRQLVPQAATVVAISQGGLPGLYSKRSGPEHDYYQPVRPFVTAQLWSELRTYISQGLTGESHQIGSFAPQASRDGVWTHIGSVPYRSTGSASVHMYGTPRVQMESDNVLVSFDLEVVGKARPADVRYEATYTAVMQYEDGAWRMNGWQNLLTSSIEVVPGSQVNQ